MHQFYTNFYFCISNHSDLEWEHFKCGSSTTQKHHDVQQTLQQNVVLEFTQIQNINMYYEMHNLYLLLYTVYTLWKVRDHRHIHRTNCTFKSLASKNAKYDRLQGLVFLIYWVKTYMLTSYFQRFPFGLTCLSLHAHVNHPTVEQCQASLLSKTLYLLVTQLLQIAQEIFWCKNM